MFPYCCLLIICIKCHNVQFSRCIFELSLIETFNTLKASINKRSRKKAPVAQIEAQRSGFDLEKEEGANGMQFSRTSHSAKMECSWLLRTWWAKVDSNHRPHDYQSCALAS